MTRISKDPRNALRLSEDDRRKNNTVIPVLGTGICKGDARVKPEHDAFLCVIMSGPRPNMTSCSQLDRNTNCGTRTFVEARCFLPTYREQVPCIFWIVGSSPTMTIIYSSFPCLARESKRDIRVKPEYDKEKRPNRHKKSRPADGFFRLFVFTPLLRRLLWRQKQFRRLQYRLWYHRHSCC